MKICILIILLTSLLLTACTNIPYETSVEPQVYFCPRDNCSSILHQLTNQSTTSIHCALYDLNLKPLLTILRKKAEHIDVQILLESSKLNPQDNFIKYDYDKQQMHNKFCIFDNQIILTGSFNPTTNGNTKNNNNIIIIKSTTLSKNYETEFQELCNNKKSKTPYPTIFLNNQKIETYFCPEDNCKDKVLQTLNNANKSIHFMLFYLTDKDITNTLINKHKQGLNIRGIMEKKNINKWSTFNNLKDSEVDLIQDKNKANLHHKVFIIDNKTVITGSYNPTTNGNQVNDENILIIHNKNIAERFLEEFDYLYS